MQDFFKNNLHTFIGQITTSLFQVFPVNFYLLNFSAPLLLYSQKSIQNRKKTMSLDVTYFINYHISFRIFIIHCTYSWEIMNYCMPVLEVLPWDLISTWLFCSQWMHILDSLKNWLSKSKSWILSFSLLILVNCNRAKSKLDLPVFQSIGLESSKNNLVWNTCT